MHVNSKSLLSVENYVLVTLLQSSFGVIPNVRAKGKASVRVADILNRMQAEEPVNSSDVIYNTLFSLISFFFCP